MLNINKCLILGIGFAFISLATGLFYYKNKYENTLVKLGSVENSLEIQNKAIKQKELALEAYKNNLKDIEANINSRYKSVNVSHENCESELKEINRILEVFYNR